MRTKVPRPTLGQLLQGWRAESGLNQKEAADLAGVNQGTWSRWERGEMMPGADHLRRIIAASDGGLTASGLVEAAAPIREAGERNEQ
jgi:transcriptional regulator with XRE-family HTH domain